jgi:hypothetical protein
MNINGRQLYLQESLNIILNRNIAGSARIESLRLNYLLVHPIPYVEKNSYFDKEGCIRKHFSAEDKINWARAPAAVRRRDSLLLLSSVAAGGG